MLKQARKVSQYGLYDALSDAYKKFLDGLHAVHTSRLQCTLRLSIPFMPKKDFSAP